LSYRASVVDAPWSRAMPGTPRPRRLSGKQTAWIQTQPAFYASLPRPSRAVPAAVACAQGGEKPRNPPGRCWPSHCTAPPHLLR